MSILKIVLHRDTDLLRCTDRESYAVQTYMRDTSLMMEWSSFVGLAHLDELIAHRDIGVHGRCLG